MKTLKIILALFFTTLLVGCEIVKTRADMYWCIVLVLLFIFMILKIIEIFNYKTIYLDGDKFAYYKLSELQKEAKKYGIEIGDNVILGKNCKLKSWVKISYNTVIGNYAFIYYRVRIGNDVKIGNCVKIMSKSEIVYETVMEDNVTIGREVVIGSNSVIGKDVTFGDYSRMDFGGKVPNGKVIPYNAKISKESTKLNKHLGITFKRVVQ